MISLPASEKKKAQTKADDSMQLSLMPSEESKVMDKLKKLDVNTLTPIECMNELFELSRLAKDT
jgi:DNA mismatch repair protein MutS